MADIVLCDCDGSLPVTLPRQLARFGHQVTQTESPPESKPPADLYVTNMVCARRLLADIRPSLTVLIITERWDSQVLREAVDMGATGLASAANSDTEIAFAVNRVATGQPYFDADLLRAALPGRSQPGATHVRRVTSKLTAREWQVLEFLARGAATSKIAAELGITTPTVRSHVHQILTKLGVHSRLEAATFVLTHQIEPPGRF